MASLPTSFAPTLASFSANTGIVQVSSANTTPTVSSMLDLVSGLGAKQLTVANQPSFSAPQGVSPALSHQSLSFGGSANMSFDSLAAKVGASWTAYVVASVVTPAGAPEVLAAFGTSTNAADGYAQLFVANSLGGFNFHNNAGVETAGAGGAIDTGIHCFVLSYGSGSVALYVDGVSAASASITGAITYDRFTFGALNSNGAISSNLTGKIYEASVFGGARDQNVESYLLYKYGLNNATNKGV